MARTSVSDAPWMPPSGGDSGMSPQEKTTGKTHLESCWTDYVTGLVWKHLRMLLKELEEVSRERDVWDSLVGLLSPVPDKQKKMGRMDENYIISDFCN